MSKTLNTANIKDLPTLLGKNLSFLREWSNANEEQFEKIMRVIADEKPEKWVDIFIKVQQTISPHTAQKSTVNVKLSKDFDTLRTLAQTTLTKSLPKQADYEEIQEV